MAIRYLIGVDEAGRGPLAGPVAVGAVCIPVHLHIERVANIRDSKQLSEHAREVAYEALRTARGIRYAVSMVGAVSVDRDGIQACIRRALTRTLKKLNVSSREVRVLLDGGLKAPKIYRHQRTIVRGDETEPVIGAASIIAKVTRDRHMVRQGVRYPAYGFVAHKGYGTAVHIRALKTHGLTPIHRRTFCSRFRSGQNRLLF